MSEYTPMGRVTEFKHGEQMGYAFGGQYPLSALREFGKLPYLREYKAHLFQPNIAFKIGVRIRFEGALDSSTNLNNIQLYRFLRNNV